jgi:hypothetical protein
MDFIDYLNEVLWGRLGRACVGLVFLCSVLFAAFCMVKVPGIPLNIYALILLGPMVLYQTITVAAATLLWLATKDWGTDE